MESIKEVLMRRDGMSASEADDLIEQAKEDLHRRLDDEGFWSAEGFWLAEDICMEWFGLGPDYLMKLILLR